jgi:hypothetical protein
VKKKNTCKSADPDLAIIAFSHMQVRKYVLTKQILSLEVCSTSVACEVPIGMIQQVTLQMLGSGESAPTSVLLAAELLALELALCIFSLTTWSHCGT